MGKTAPLICVQTKVIALVLVGLLSVGRAAADEIDDFVSAAVAHKHLPPPQQIDTQARGAFVGKWGIHNQLFITVLENGMYIEHPQRDLGAKWLVNRSNTRIELMGSDDTNQVIAMIYMIGGQPYMVSHEDQLTPLTRYASATKQWR